VVRRGRRLDGPRLPQRNPYAPRLPYFRAKVRPRLVRFQLPGSRVRQLAHDVAQLGLSWGVSDPSARRASNAAPNIGDVGGELEPVGGDSGKPMVWQPGKMYEAPPGYELKFTAAAPDWPGRPADGADLPPAHRDGGVASVLRGAAGSDYSGYLANQLLAAATLTYKHLGTAIESQLAEMGEFIWHVMTRASSKRCTCWPRRRTARTKSPKSGSA
jgi:hypothetical protein